MENGEKEQKQKNNMHTKTYQPIHLLDAKAEISNVPECLYS